MDLPQEIFDEILMHLRREWAAHPTVLSNSGLQIALTCSWLHNALSPEIKARWEAIITSAMNDTLPGPEPYHGPLRLLSIYGNVGAGLRNLTPSDISTFQAQDSTRDKNKGIHRIYLDLPVLRASDTDLIWSVRQLVLNQHLGRAGSRLTDFHLSLHKIVEVMDRDEGSQARWVRAFGRMLDTVASLQRGCYLQLSYKNDAGGQDDDDEAFEKLVRGSHINDGQAPPGSAISRHILPRRMQGLFAAAWRGRSHLGLSSIALTGPLSNPLFHASASYIIRRSPRIDCLNVEGPSSSPTLWNSTTNAGWALPRLTTLILTHVQISLPTLLTFLSQHPTVTFLCVYRWCHTDSDANHTAASSPAAKSVKLRITSLTAEPSLLKLLLDSRAELPKLRSLNVKCTYSSSFDSANPTHWAELTLTLALLARRQTTMNMSTPFMLTLSLPHCDSLLGWLNSIHIQPQDCRPPTVTANRTAIQSILHRFGSSQKRHVANLIDKTNLPPLSEILRGLHCVTSFNLYTTRARMYPAEPVAGVSPNSIATLIMALPSVKGVHVGAYFPQPSAADSNGLQVQRREVWSDDMKEVWSGSRSLKSLYLRDTGTFPQVTWAWHRGMQPQEA